MMKVCILSNDAPAAFQSSINAFIADKKVIDIKYQSEQMMAVRCKCGHPAHVWHSRDGYLCGCISPDCTVSLERSRKSKAEAIEKWNAKMKGEKR